MMSKWAILCLATYCISYTASQSTSYHRLGENNAFAAKDFSRGLKSWTGNEIVGKKLYKLETRIENIEERPDFGENRENMENYVLTKRKGLIPSIYNFLQSILVAITTTFWTLGSDIDLILRNLQNIIHQLTAFGSLPTQKLIEFLGFQTSILLNIASKGSGFIPIGGKISEPTLARFATCVKNATSDLPPGISQALDSCLMAPISNLDYLILSATQGISNITMTISITMNDIYKCQGLLCPMTSALELRKLPLELISTALGVVSGFVGIFTALSVGVTCITTNIVIEPMVTLPTLSGRFLNCLIF